MVERSTKAPKIKQTFGRAIESDAHAVEQINDRGRGLAHGFYRRLVGKEVAAVDSVVKVLPRGVAFALQVLGGVASALRADRVRALDRNDGAEGNASAGFGDLDDRCEAATSASY